MGILDRISYLLKADNKEQKDLTNFLGLNNVAFSDWKAGKSKSYLKYLIEIAEFFDVSIDYLAYGKENLLISELSDDEQELLNNYKKLSDKSKGRILGKVETLVEIETKEIENSISEKN